jgi:MraZ protein
MLAASFIGKHACKRDEQGRVPFPAAFRSLVSPSANPQQDKDGKVLPLRLRVQKELDAPYLTIMTDDECEKKIAYYREQLDPYDSEQHEVLVTLFDSMASAELDSAGRIMLPKWLVEDVGMGKDVLFLGMGHEIHLWDKLRYEEIKSARSPEKIAAMKKFLQRKTRES